MKSIVQGPVKWEGVKWFSQLSDKCMLAVSLTYCCQLLHIATNLHVFTWVLAQRLTSTGA